MPTIYSEGYSAIWEMWAKGVYPLAVRGNRHDLALTYVTFGPMPFWALDQYQKALRGR